MQKAQHMPPASVCSFKRSMCFATQNISSCNVMLVLKKMHTAICTQVVPGLVLVRCRKSTVSRFSRQACQYCNMTTKLCVLLVRISRTSWVSVFTWRICAHFGSWFIKRNRPGWWRFGEGGGMQEVVRNRRLCCVQLIQRASAPPSALDAEKSREFALFVLSLDRRKAVLLRS